MTSSPTRWDGTQEDPGWAFSATWDGLLVGWADLDGFGFAVFFLK